MEKGKIPKQTFGQKKECLVPYQSMDSLRTGNNDKYCYPDDGVYIKDGDIIILWDGSNAGELLLAKHGVLSSTMSLLDLQSEGIIKEYGYYLLKSLEKEIRNNTVGMGIPHVDGNYLKSIKLLLPPISEQTQIVSILDEKTAKIDSLIEKKERKIELLKEKRKALINHAVTKGLNPDVPMKDSGVEWIGEIPDGWELVKLKYLAEINPSKKKEVDVSQKVVFLPMEKVSEDGKINQDDMREYGQVNSGYTYFEKNDILLAKITPCFENGKGAYLKNLRSEIGFGSTEFHVIRAHDILDKILYYNIRREGFKKVGETFMSGAAGQKRVSTDFLEEWLIAVPPKEEQNSIVTYLDKETSEIDRLVGKEQQKIELLKEYRQSLISEVVTGKIDVRAEVSDNKTKVTV
jgi:type I restriction enzyme S subunit